MFLLVLRLLAVYFGTVTASLWLAHRFVSRIRPGAAVLLAIGPFLFVGKALLTAGVHAPIDIPYECRPLSQYAEQAGVRRAQTPNLSDVVFQEIPWRKAVREAVKNGRLPLWNRFVLSGEPLLAMQQPAVLHPGTWIGFLLPLAQAWTLEMALRYFLALLGAYLFLDALGCGVTAALLGAAGWAFCDYLVFFLGYPLTPAAAPFPLLLLGLSRLARDADRRAVTLTVVALLLILTAGHPETLLYCVAAGGLYFLFELTRPGPGRRLRAVLLSLVAGVLTLGLSAVILLPLADVLPHTQEHWYRKQIYTHIRQSQPLEISVRRALPDVVPFAYGAPGKGSMKEGFTEPAGYAGSAVWPLAAVGLFSRRREKWAVAGLGVLGLVIHTGFRGVMDVVSSLPLFDIGLNERVVFLGAFAAAALAALGLERLKEPGGARVLAAAAVLALGALAALFLRAQPDLSSLGMPSGYYRSRVLLQVVPLAICVVLSLLLRDRRRSGAAMSAALLLVVAQRGLEEKDVYPTYPSRAFYPPVRSLEPISREIPARMVALGFTFIPNIAALYELEDARGYEAMTFKPYFETYPLWCVYQPVWYNRVDDPTKPFLSFLNVRYVFAAPGVKTPPGWKVLHSSEEGLLFENPAALSRAFVPRSLRYEADGARRLALLETIRDFAVQGVLGEAPPAGVSPEAWQVNGDATARISAYSPERLTLDIDAKTPAVVATSVTAWPGWRLTVDGAKTPLVSYNHAFLSFRVPPGRHTAVLRYWPDSFAYGLAVSGATLALCLLLLFSASKRQRPNVGAGTPVRSGRRPWN